MTAQTDPDRVIAAEEAELVGVGRARITRARQDPTHPGHVTTTSDGRRVPTNQGAIIAGTSVAAPRAAVLAWWSGQQRGAGRPRRNPPMPEGWTHHQWKSLLAHTRTGAPLSAGVRAVLVERGVLDEDGQLTASGRALITIDRQEQR